eukprot:GHVS01078147.1.p1 GENE.GHVS01078147.1~~GHVS01078147.1.p1  ORF type:complete len:128 (-),score=10.31 GHVS01078147.1:124-507(-)
MLKELGTTSSHGDLSYWADQGVFMCNAMLTVVDGCPLAHQHIGWTEFTDRVINIINVYTDKVVFLLWGKAAQAKGSAVDRSRHTVLEAGHPSPLSQRHFFGCDHFNKCNEILRSWGKQEIDWHLPQV